MLCCLIMEYMQLLQFVNVMFINVHQFGLSVIVGLYNSMKTCKNIPKCDVSFTNGTLY